MPTNNCTCGQCTSEIRICTQVSVPVVDNTVPNCEDAIYEECILMTEERSNPFPITINDTLKQTLNSILQELADAKARILVLENYNITNP